MLTLHKDVIINISNKLSNREKIMWSATSKYMDMIKYKFIYHDKVHVDKIADSSYFDNFECVGINSATIKCPKRVNSIFAEIHSTLDLLFSRILKEIITQPVIHLTLRSNLDVHLSIEDYFPQPTHLIFGPYYNGKNYNIPNTITHLTFSRNFNRSIKDIIPPSVTHLTFGYNFNQCIKKDNIPPSVTHLTFGNNFNQPIIDCIPPSITHLMFGRKFKQLVGHYIPSSVTHLIFSNDYNRRLEDDIPSSVTHLINNRDDVLSYVFSWTNI